FSDFFFDPAESNTHVVFTDPQDFPHFLVAEVLKVQGDKCPVCFVQLSDGIMQFFTAFIFGSDFWPCFTMIIFQRELLYFMFSKGSHSGIQTYSIHPGG